MSMLEFHWPPGRLQSRLSSWDFQTAPLRTLEALLISYTWQGQSRRLTHPSKPWFVVMSKSPGLVNIEGHSESSRFRNEGNQGCNSKNVTESLHLWPHLGDGVSWTESQIVQGRKWLEQLTWLSDWVKETPSPRCGQRVRDSVIFLLFHHLFCSLNTSSVPLVQWEHSRFGPKSWQDTSCRPMFSGKALVLNVKFFAETCMAIQSSYSKNSEMSAPLVCFHFIGGSDFHLSSIWTRIHIWVPLLKSTIEQRWPW